MVDDSYKEFKVALDRLEATRGFLHTGVDAEVHSSVLYIIALMILSFSVCFACLVHLQLVGTLCQGHLKLFFDAVRGPIFFLFVTLHFPWPLTQIAYLL